MKKYTLLLLAFVFVITTFAYTSNRKKSQIASTSRAQSTPKDKNKNKKQQQNQKNNKNMKDQKKKTKKNKNEQNNEPHYLQPNTLQFWLNALLATFLATAGGFCSGMTVGLNSLSTLNLQLMQRSQSNQQRKMANRIIGVIKDHHLFLVTLLVGNALVLQSLPLVIHLIMPDWAAILFSTIIVLVVAEVVPMSLSTGTHKYIIAYYGAPLVNIMITVFYPICYPMARGLDKLLGKQHKQRIFRRDFMALVRNQHKNQLNKLQVQFIGHIMNQKNRTMQQLMTPFDKLITLQANSLIDDQFIHQISHHQHPYILISKQNNIVGYAKTSQVIHQFMAKKQSSRLKVQELLKQNINTKIIKIYQDCIAIQTFKILNENNVRLVIICKQKKRSIHAEHQIHTGLKTKSWQLEGQDGAGVVTIQDVIGQMVDFPRKILRKSSSLVFQN